MLMQNWTLILIPVSDFGILLEKYNPSHITDPPMNQAGVE